MTENLKEARIVGSKVYSPDGVCVGGTCANKNDPEPEPQDYDIPELEAAMREHLPDTLEALRRKDKALTVSRTGELLDYLATKQHEQRQELNQLKADHVRTIWNEQRQAADKVTDQATYDEYLAKRNQLQQLARMTREASR